MNRYRLLVLAVPTLISAVGWAGLTSLELQLRPAQWATLVSIVLLAYGGGAAVLDLRTRGTLREIADSPDGSDLSGPLTRLLDVTSSGGNLWVAVSGLVAVVMSTLLVSRTINGFFDFVTSAIVVAVLMLVWSYASVKNLLSAESRRSSGSRHIGNKIGLGRKLAVFFIGVFVASILALVQLVTANVSQRLEQLALSEARRDWEGTRNIAASDEELTPQQLVNLDGYIDSKFSLYRIDPSGEVLKSQTYTDPDLNRGDVTEVLSRGTGDSSTFYSHDVMYFEKMADGSILVMRVPFEEYGAIPTRVTIYGLAVGIPSVLLFAGVTFFLARDVTNPLREVSLTAEEMARGDFRKEVKVFTDDEVSGLADSFASTRNNLRALIGEIDESGSGIANGISSIVEGRTQLVDATRQQFLSATQSTDTLSEARNGAEATLAAAGAVSASAERTSESVQELERSAASIASNMDQLSQTVERMSSSTTEMTATAGEISSRTKHVAETSVGFNASMQAMQSKMETLREHATSTASISSQVRQNAMKGGEAVANSLDGIRVTQDAIDRAAAVITQLTANTAQISQILVVIEDIARKTNLLSLNAAIIAAKAGRDGAAFAVVAEEIRDLAEQTRTSTSEISEIVKAIQSGSSRAVAAMEDGVSRVSENVSVAQEAESALKTIIGSSEQSVSRANEIARQLDEEATTARRLAGESTTMADSLREVDRGTRELADAVAALSKETHGVAEIARRVKSATDEQLSSSRNIGQSMEDVTNDADETQRILREQIAQLDLVARASETVLTMAQQNEQVSSSFASVVEAIEGANDRFRGAIRKFKL